jgi:ketosteroid isomerase-like protein
LGFYAPDIEWDMTDRVFNPKMYRGHAGVREWQQDLRSVWSSWRNEPERFVGAGDHVVAVIRSVGEGKGSGVELGERWAQVWTVADGKIIAMRHYRDVDAALASVGASGA